LHFNNYFIHKVHGKSIQSVKDKVHLLDDCPADAEIELDTSIVNETVLKTTKTSNLYSSSDYVDRMLTDQWQLS
jgi:hypothetical protein